MSIQVAIDNLQAERAKAQAIADACTAALAALAPNSRAETAMPKPVLAPKKAKAPAKAAKKAPKLKKAPAADDEPRTVRGTMPKVGVSQVLCSDLRSRQKRVADLKEQGYTRVGSGAPLAAGTFDVRPTGDGDDSAVVLWRPIVQKDEVAA